MIDKNRVIVELLHAEKIFYKGYAYLRIRPGIRDDAVALIRKRDEQIKCKDCRWCDLSHYCHNIGMGTQDDWYCADAER